MWRELYDHLAALFPEVTIDTWWGIVDPYERMVGSVLVQNTTWTNAAKALMQLHKQSIAKPAIIAAYPVDKLVCQIRSAGFQQRKAETLIRLSQWLVDKGGVEALQQGSEPTEDLRRELLEIKGIGEETADTILAYSLGRATISGDAYSRRLYERLTGQKASYGQIRTQILREITEYTELAMLHALIVEHGKHYCRKHTPKCLACPIQSCHYAKQ